MDPSVRRLKPGDVLLFHGHGFVSWAIRRFDASDVDHAAIVLDPETMVEATASGLRHVAIRPAVEGNALTYAVRLSGGVDPSAVVERTLSLESKLSPLTYERVILLAVLATMRRLPILDESFRRLLCVLLDRAAGMVDRLSGRGRRLMADSEFVYRCFEGTGEAGISLEGFSAPGCRPDATSGPAPERADEMMLWEWAAGRSEPSSRIPRWPQEPLEPLIAAFARTDSPDDPIVPRSYVPDAAAESGRRVDDDQLHAAAVRFRDAIVRLETRPNIRRGADVDHPWGSFRAVANVVTSGDLRSSRSLQAVATLRPSGGPAAPLTKARTRNRGR